MKKIDLSLILPCYNEAEHFANSADYILATLKKSPYKFEIIFVEDKSTDDTTKLLKSFIKKNKSESLRAIYHRRNQGRGRSVADGMRRARGVHVGFIDIDCEVSPRYIPRFIRLLKQGYDVVCADRRYKIDVSGLVRAVASKAYIMIRNLLLQTKLSDTEAGYKFFRRKSILPILKQTKDKGWFWDTEIMVRAKHAGLDIAFLPVRFNRRRDKASTVNILTDTGNYLKKLWQFRQSLIIKKQSHDKSQISEYWQKKSSAFSNQYATVLGLPLSPVGLFLQLRHKKIVRLLAETSGKTLVDVGCGSAVHMIEAINLGKRPIGIDYSKQMLQQARKNLSKFPSTKYQLLYGNATKLPIQEYSADIILASGLTDYLTSDQVGKFFTEIKRVLKKNGIAIVTFPRYDSIFSFLRTGYGLKLRKKLLKLPPMKTAYSKADITKLYAAIGKKPKRWDSVMGTMWIVKG